MASRLETIFRDHYAWLRDRLRRHTESVHSAEDVAGDTFVQLAERPTLDDIKEPRALLTTIARRTLYEVWRRRDLEQAYLQTLAAAPQPLQASPEERALVLETLVTVDRVLDDLPAKARRAFLYSQLDGMTYAEIALELGVSPSMIRQYMSRALTAIVTVTQ